MNDLDLTVRLKADGSGLRGEIRLSKKDIEKLGKELDDTGKEAGQAANKLDKYGKETKQAGDESRKLKGETAGVGSAMGSLRGIIGGLGLAAFVTNLIRTNSEFSLLRASLETVTGSSQAAEAAFGRIQDFAASTPFDLQQVTQAFIKLQALGLDPSEQAMTSYGNTASAMGKSLNQMIEAVADAATGEFERLKEFGIKARSEGDRVSFTFRGVSTTVKKEADDIEAYLMRLGEVEFAGGMERQSKTLAGAISNLGDAWDQMLDRLLGGVLENAIATAIRWFSSLLDLIGEFGDAVNYALNLMGFESANASAKVSSLGDASLEAAGKIEGDLAEAATTAAGAVDELGTSAGLTGQALIGLEFAQVATDIAALETRLSGASENAAILAQELVSGRLAQAEYTIAMQAISESVDKTQSALQIAKERHATLNAILKQLASTESSVTSGTKRRTASIDAATKAAAAHKKALSGTIAGLTAQLIELEKGARAAYEYDLKMQGFSDAEAQVALALYDTIRALEAKRDAEEGAARASEDHATVNQETAGAFQQVWKNAVNSVDNIFRDLWRGAFDSAQDFGQSLKEWFSNLLAELAHQALTRPIVLSLGAAFGAGVPGSAVAGGGLAGGGIGDLAGSLLTNTIGAGGLLGAAGSFFGSIGMGSFGAGLIGAGGGIGSALATAGAGLAGGGIGMTIGALMPYLLPLIPLIGGLFNDEEAPTKFKLSSTPDWVASGGGIDTIKTMGNTTYGTRDGNLRRVQVDSKFGSMGVGISAVGKDEQMSEEEARKWMDSITGVLQELAQMDDVLAGLLDEDGLAAVTSAMEEFEQSMADTKGLDVDAFIRQRYDAIFAAAGGAMDAIYDAMVATSGGADMTAIVGQVTAFFATFDAYQNIFENHDELVRQNGMTLTEAMAENATALHEQIAAYDGSLEANQQITAGMAQRYQMELQYLAQIDAAQQAVSVTLGKSIEAIRLSQMTDQQRYDYLTDQSEALAASLANMTDPAQITNTVNEINRLTMAAWNSMSEEQQAQVAGGYEEFLAAVDERANSQLEKSREEAQKEHGTLVQAYTDMGAAARALADAVLDDAGTAPTPDATAPNAPASLLDEFINSNAAGATAAVKIDGGAEKINGGADKLLAAARQMTQAADRMADSAGAFGSWTQGLPDSFSFNLAVDVPQYEVG